MVHVKYIQLLTLPAICSAKNVRKNPKAIERLDSPDWVDACSSPSTWDEWTDEFDCFWQNENQQWWYHSTPGHARGSSYWNNWNSIQMERFLNLYDSFDMSYYYDNKHDKVCLPGGDLLGTAKVTANTMVTNCTNPVAAYQKPFSQVRHHDMKVALPATAVNYATVYDDKTRQSNEDAAANGHPDWTYGQYINYDHLPAKTCYMSSCNGGSSGQRLPTVAIMAIDHKGPVWTNCTTSRSSSSDNHRSSINKMKTYIANNQYGRAILENLDCLLEASIYYEMPETFTDYELGFLNLVELHYQVNDINENEKETLISYVEQAAKDPYGQVYNTKYWDSILVEEDTYLVPDFC